MRYYVIKFLSCGNGTVDCLVKYFLMIQDTVFKGKCNDISSLFKMIWQ